MYVEFVNMFTDPTGFFKTAPMWVSFILPGAINALLVITTAAILGITTKNEDTAIMTAWISGLSALAVGSIFWGIIVTPAFAAHGVNPEFPTAISFILGFLAMASETCLATLLFTKFVSKNF